MSFTQKILVCGDVCGNLNQLHKRILAINKKNPTGSFDLLLCVGEFFSSEKLYEWEPYKEGKIKFPIPTYILGPTIEKNCHFYPDMKGCELAENIVYLGRSGIYPCSSGLKIAYLSGFDNSDNSQINFSLDDVKNIEMTSGNKPKIDILITSEWPKEVFEYAKYPVSLDRNAGNHCASIDLSAERIEIAQRADSTLLPAIETLNGSRKHKSTDLGPYFPNMVLRQGVLLIELQKRKGFNDINRWRVVLPRDMRQEVLKEAHNSKLAGHGGFFKTKERLFQTFWWAGMDKDIQNHVNNCIVCQDGLDVEKIGSPLVSRLAFKLKPRYHFVGYKDIFYERLPYRNHAVLKEAAHHVTRFISLAKVGSPSKEKWLYAFNLIPIKNIDPNELVKQPPDVTECPYSEKLLAKAENATKKVKSTNQFFYDTSGNYEDLDNRGGKRKKEFSEEGTRKKYPPKQTGPCWFCLASPDVEKHLVVSVGTYSYLALAKGGLVPDHLLILPIEHFQSTSDIEPECREEIEKFKSNLRKMFESTGKVVVFFERNYRTQHMQIQAVPLPSNFSSQIKESFIDISESTGISLDEVPKHSDISQLAPPGTPFFYVELPDGKKMFHRIRKGFPLQFGREVLACPPLLNIEERVDWRECKISADEETLLRNRIRESFKPFDFTLESDDSDSDSDESNNN